jgi:hypothetical protein
VSRRPAGGVTMMPGMPAAHDSAGAEHGEPGYDLLVPLGLVLAAAGAAAGLYMLSAHPEYVWACAVAAAAGLVQALAGWAGSRA